MVFVVYQEGGKCSGGLFYSYEEFNQAMFSPEREQIFITDFVVHGASYADRKQAARDIGIGVSNSFGLVSLFWSECMYIGDKLQGLAARYGLVKEFRENGLI